ncbi:MULTISPECIES: class II aldolase/adducin family protein [Bacillus]|uniref:class II aldolase/adducin family protein n=1 Tax=Bacillus TaxID=1386 RepID=UPI001F1EA7D5|nr:MULTISPECIES: class II aldolase/adducin family protein [Bacillus]
MRTVSIKGKNIYYILTGARKSKESYRYIKELSDLGANVFVILTPSAHQMVDLELLKEASGNFIRDSFDKKDGESLPLEDLIVIAPATYSTINKIAGGIADNFATSCIAAAIGRNTPIYLAPSMNIDLWRSPILQQNLQKLIKIGVKMIHPRIEGSYCTMAFGEKVNDSIIYDFNKIRFKSIQVLNDDTDESFTWHRTIKNVYEEFKEVGGKLVTYGLTNGSKGCISKRVEKGFVITSSGCELGNIKMEELVWVQHVDHLNNEVYWKGINSPSSETPLHYEVYANTEMKSVIHSHCPSLTYATFLDRYRSNSYLRYGTFQFGKGIIHKMQSLQSNFAIARDHGEIVVGNTLEKAIEHLIKIQSDSSRELELV